MHGLGVAVGQDEAGADATLRADGAEDLGRFRALVLGRRRSAAAWRPAPGELGLLTVIAGVQFDARNAPSINPSSKLDIETGSLDSTPAAAAFCSDVAECPVTVDGFGTDASLVEAGGGAEGSPFVTEGFWEQLLEDEGGGGGDTSDDEGASLDQGDDGN